jgi:hypothetical protein
MNIEAFENSFDLRVGTCRAKCNCGKIFYNPSFGADWEDGELDKLYEDQNATMLDYSVGFVRFEGVEYVMSCNCWHERAKKIMSFIDDHSHQIADYLNHEKKRKLAEANNMPTV